MLTRVARVEGDVLRHGVPEVAALGAELEDGYLRVEVERMYGGG